MRRFLTVLFLLSYAAAAQKSSHSEAFSDLDETVSRLAKITGLAPLKKVQYDTITRPQVKAFLEERIKEEIRPEDLRVDEMVLKRFGFVPQDFDLKATTVDLITEQAAAFYDYRKKKLFLLQGDEVKVPGASEAFSREAQQMIVTHELAHALADQHFDLGKFIRKGPSDDASTARMAVMEGQATWLMLESMAQKMGHSVREQPQMVDLMGAGASEAMMSQYPVMAKAPLYLRASLIFPYNQGLKFQHALVQKLGNPAFSRVFRDAPATTQQILHPDLYLSGTVAAKTPVPELAHPKQWKTIAEGTVGEFDHAILIEQYLSKETADALAPAWRGGSFALTENRAGRNIALLYASQWRDEASAKQMFDAYAKVLQGKWKHTTFTEKTDRLLSGTGDDGAFVVALDGSRLTSVEGLKTVEDAVRRLD